MAPQTTSIQLPLTIRQSTTHLAIRLILLQLIFALIYMFLTISVRLFDATPQIREWAYSLANILIIPIVLYQLGLMLWVILDWVGNSYILREGEIVVRSGIINRKEKIFAIKHIESISCNQSWFERIFNYGTLRLFNPLLQQNVNLVSVKNPQKYLKVLEAISPELKQEKKVIYDTRPARIVFV